MKRLFLVLSLSLGLVPVAALAWGGSGHRMIGQVAIESLPSDLPGFLRNPRAATDVGELAREPDRWKGAGKVHDQNRDPGHFVDLSDDGTILGGPRLENLPTTRKDYEAALKAAGTNSWDAGYLPYSILETQQQLTKDFAYWRVTVAAERRERNPAHRAWLKADLARREDLILSTLGQLSHYVGDGSQPLHVTVHYNGWGDFPDPKGYTTNRVHGPFESDFVAANISLRDVRGAMLPLKPATGPLEARIAAYLVATGRSVIPFYELEKQGGFQGADPRGVAFALTGLSTGASEFRDLIVEAWRTSPRMTVGWPAVSLADVESGRVDAYLALYSKD